MAERRNKRGEVFSETLERINHQFPALNDAKTEGWAGHGLSWIFNTPDDQFLMMFAGMIADGFEASKGHTSRTSRPKLEWGPTLRGGEDVQEIRRVFQHLVDPGYSSLPFAEAFRVLAGDRSQRHLARKVSIERSRVARLLAGVYPPTGDEMERIAGAFGKPRHYFREYRSVMIAAAVMARLDEDPDGSAALIRKVAV